jgi:hypothetical protein
MAQYILMQAKAISAAEYQVKSVSNTSHSNLHKYLKLGVGNGKTEFMARIRHQNS